MTQNRTSLQICKGKRDEEKKKKEKKRVGGGGGGGVCADLFKE